MLSGFNVPTPHITALSLSQTVLVFQDTELVMGTNMQMNVLVKKMILNDT